MPLRKFKIKKKKILEKYRSDHQPAILNDVSMKVNRCFHTAK
jgi:hypothetical protein